MNRRVFFAVLLAFSMTAVSYAEDPPFKLTGMKLFSDKILNKIEKKDGGFSASFGAKIGDSNSPGTELSGFEFPETQLVQHFAFQFGPGSAGKTLSVSVIGEKTTLGAENKIIDLSGEVDKDGSLPMRVSLKQNWPPGLYRAEFSFEGKPVGSAGYLVKAVKDRTAPITLQAMTIYTMENGKGVERKDPKPSDHYLEFHTDTTGAKTAGATVLWKFSTMSADGKPENEVVHVEIKDWPLENTTLVHSSELPKDWPAGKYVCEYLVDGALIGTKTFEIKP